MPVSLTRRALVLICKARGVLLIDQGAAVSIDAPPGQVFQGSGLHSHTIYTDGWKRGEVYAELAEEIGGGCVPCSDPDCDTCAAPTTFEELLTLYPGERLA